MTARPALRRAVAPLILVTLGALPTRVPAAAAAAHDGLLFSDPSDTGALAAVPSRAVLIVTGPVAEVQVVTVTGQDGSLTNGDARARWCCGTAARCRASVAEPDGEAGREAVR